MSGMGVAIIMPAFNAEETIDGSIMSVVRQSYTNWCLLIIDDASTDGTYEIAQKWCVIDKRVKHIRLEKRSGVATARNIGLDLVRTSHIAFLDSDDRWAPDKLDKQLEFMVGCKSEITFSSYYRINTSSEIIGCVMPPKTVSYRKMLKGNFIGNSTAIFFRGKLADIRFKTIGNEDHLFWLHCLKRLDEPVFSTPSDNPLAYYLVRKNSLSGNKFKSLKYEWHIYRNELNFNIFKTVFYLYWHLYNGFLKRRHRHKHHEQ